MVGYDIATVIYVVIGLFSLSGLLLSVHAVMHVKTSQATIAWCFALLFFPYVTVFLYLIFGRSRLDDYVSAHQLSCDVINIIGHGVQQASECQYVGKDDIKTCLHRVLREQRHVFTPNNHLELLINGDEAYPQMLAAIANAKHYIILQSYIIRNDETGKKFQQALIAKKNVRIYLLYDEIGSAFLDNQYLKSLKQAGVQISDFGSTKRGFLNRFKVNFRNHRKLLIVDGELGFMGGLNIGDEYLGKNKRFGPWRDTHLKIIGPAVGYMQLTFMADWYWANQEMLELSWQPWFDQSYQQDVMMLSHGPQQHYSAALLTLNTLCYRAKNRIWIASPYFVPESSILKALVTAALRGVDVRILLPSKADHRLVYLCSYSYYPYLVQSGVKIYRYNSGFMHQKVWLFDDEIAGVGTTNLDNRSLLLNFELMALNTDTVFIKQVSLMLNQDFALSRIENIEHYQQRSWFFRFIVRLSRLFSPIL